MSTDLIIETIADPQPVIEQLEEKIYQHNSTVTGKRDGILFSRIIRDKHRNMIAGVAGWTWANACEITHLWVQQNERKNGIGKKLLLAAEAEARSKGCVSMIVKSYSFQAPEFYLKHGYTTQYVLRDFPIGHDYYFLIKEIV